jgi:hypothetical protein
MQDFRRDWRRWSTGERVAATGIAAFVLLFVPLSVALSNYTF